MYSKSGSGEIRPNIADPDLLYSSAGASHTTLFTKAWQIQTIDIRVRKEEYIYIYIYIHCVSKKSSPLRLS